MAAGGAAQRGAAEAAARAAGAYRHAAVGVPVVAGGVLDMDGEGAESAGLVVVGSAVGSAAYMAAHARGVYGRAARLLLLLQVVLSDTQTHFLLAHKCALSTLTFTMRTTPPSAQRDAACAFDGVSRRAFALAAHMGPLDAAASVQIRLPLRHGGCGWTSASWTLDFAYVASSVSVIDGCCQLGPHWRELAVAWADELDDDGEADGGLPPCWRELQAAHRRVLLRLPPASQAAASYSPTLSEVLASPAHLQRRLSHSYALLQRHGLEIRLAASVHAARRAEQHARLRARDVLAVSDSAAAAAVAVAARTRARHALHAALRRAHAFRASRSWGATDFLAAVPDSVDYSGYVSMTPAAFRISLHVLLGLPYQPLVRGGPYACPCTGERPCGLDHDPFFDVALTCSAGGHSVSRGLRHDLWVGAWCAFLRAHGYRVETDHQLRARFAALPGRTKRPDLLATTPEGALLPLDAAIGHATCPLSHAALDALGAPRGLPARGQNGHLVHVERLERGKCGEYRRQYRQGLWPPPCLAQRPVAVVPLAASTYGCVGPAARRLFSAVVRRAERHAAVVSDAVQQQGLARSQHIEMWRRRLCVFLRIAVATQVMGRVQDATQAGGAAARGSRTGRGSFEWARVVPRRVAFPGRFGRRATAPVRDPLGGGSGGAFGGDVPRAGIMGDGVQLERVRQAG